MATKFPAHIHLTTQEAADALDCTQYTVLQEVLQFYTDLVKGYETILPTAGPDKQRQFALAAVCVAGHVQGMLEHNRLAQRMKQAAELPGSAVNIEDVKA